MFCSNYLLLFFLTLKRAFFFLDVFEESELLSTAVIQTPHWSIYMLQIITRLFKIICDLLLKKYTLTSFKPTSQKAVKKI